MGIKTLFSGITVTHGYARAEVGKVGMVLGRGAQFQAQYLHTSPKCRILSRKNSLNPLKSVAEYWAYVL